MLGPNAQRRRKPGIGTGPGHRKRREMITVRPFRRARADRAWGDHRHARSVVVPIRATAREPPGRVWPRARHLDRSLRRALAPIPLPSAALVLLPLPNLSSDYVLSEVCCRCGRTRRIGQSGEFGKYPGSRLPGSQLPAPRTLRFAGDSEELDHISHLCSNLGPGCGSLGPSRRWRGESMAHEFVLAAMQSGLTDLDLVEALLAEVPAQPGRFLSSHAAMLVEFNWGKRYRFQCPCWLFHGVFQFHDPDRRA